jgi:hypothetical protein
LSPSFVEPTVNWMVAVPLVREIGPPGEGEAGAGAAVALVGATVAAAGEAVFAAGEAETTGAAVLG